MTFGLLTYTDVHQVEVSFMAIPPIGFVISSDWGMKYLWSCMLVSSVVKWAVLKLGGRRASQQLIMLAIGLMLGGFIIAGLWSLLGVFIKTPMYNFWP